MKAQYSKIMQAIVEKLMDAAEALGDLNDAGVLEEVNTSGDGEVIRLFVNRDLFDKLAGNDVKLIKAFSDRAYIASEIAEGVYLARQGSVPVSEAVAAEDDNEDA